MEESSPLLPPSSNRPFPPVRGITKMILFKGLKTDFWVFPAFWFDLILSCALVLGSINFLTTSATITEAASLFTCIFTMYILYQRFILRQLGTFRNLHNQMRDKINQFMLENNQLISSIDRLESSIHGLQDIEKGLQQLCKTNQVDSFVQCVTKTRQVNQQIKENISARIIQDILTTMLRTDRNNDLSLDDRELNRLMVRLTIMPGLEFHEDRFYKVLGENKHRQRGVYGIGEMMQVFRNLLDDTLPDQDNVFVLQPKQLL